MKKIMFSDRYGLTQAVIERRKTMTRRIMNNQYGNLAGCIEFTKKGRACTYVRADFDNGISEDAIYAIDEIVAVVQKYYNVFSPKYDLPVDGLDKTPGWRNKMFVRADLMNHQIRITGIKCERLQDISEADCLKEGIRQAYAESILGMYGYIDHEGIGLWFNTPREAFVSLIDKVSGRGTWASNPLVVAYEFELVK